MAVVKTNVSERDGVDLLEAPEEINMASDFIGSAGVAFQGSADHVIERIGGIIKNTIPNYSLKPTYTGNNLTAYEIFTTNTQTTTNRRVRGDFTYTSNNLTSESWKIYDEADGTTVLRTITITHTYTSNNLTNTEVSEA